MDATEVKVLNGVRAVLVVGEVVVPPEADEVVDNSTPVTLHQRVPGRTPVRPTGESAAAKVVTLE